MYIEGRISVSLKHMHMLIISVKEFDTNRTTKIHCSMHVWPLSSTNTALVQRARPDMGIVPLEQ